MNLRSNHGSAASDGEARNNITGGVRTRCYSDCAQAQSFSAASVLRPTTIAGCCDGRYRRAPANKTKTIAQAASNFACARGPYSSLNNVQDAPDGL